jgi:hypothetical protein
MGMSDEDPGLGLAAAIKLVRSELQQAMEDGQSSPLAFTAGPVQLEFEVAFGKGKEGGGGIQAWVVSVDFRGNKSSTNTNRVTISLTPTDRATGKDIKVSDRSRE